jgi:hypothetical protein
MSKLSFSVATRETKINCYIGRGKREERRWKMEERRWKIEGDTVALCHSDTYNKALFQIPSNKFQINNQVTNYKLQAITKVPITKQLRLSENWLIANWGR